MFLRIYSSLIFGVNIGVHVPPNATLDFLPSRHYVILLSAVNQLNLGGMMASAWRLVGAKRPSVLPVFSFKWLASLFDIAWRLLVSTLFRKCWCFNVIYCTLLNITQFWIFFWQYRFVWCFRHMSLVIIIFVFFCRSLDSSILSCIYLARLWLIVATRGSRAVV